MSGKKELPSLDYITDINLNRHSLLQPSAPQHPDRFSRLPDGHRLWDCLDTQLPSVYSLLIPKWISINKL